MARPYYRVQVTVGPKTWDVTSTDDPAPGPVLPLTFGWAVPDNSLGFPAQPDPASASLTIAAPTPDHVDGIDIGSPVAVSAWLHDPATLATNLAEGTSGAALWISQAGSNVSVSSVSHPTDRQVARFAHNGATYEVFHGPFIQVTAGDVFRVSVALSRESGDPLAITIGVPGGGTLYGESEPTTVGAWQVLTRTFQATVTGAHRVRLQNYFNPTNGVTHVGPVMVDKTTGPETLAVAVADYPASYFDGDTPGAAWTGTPNASTSVNVALAATGIIAAFAGRVAEMRARPDLTHGTVYQITALDYSVDLSASLVGGTAWPAETAEARSDRILAEAGKTPPAGLAPDPGGNVGARAAAPVSARDILLETLAHGVTTDKARWIVTSDVNAESGALDVVPYSYRPVRRAVYAIDVLDPCVIDVGVEWVRSRRSAADWITIDHPGGPTIYGNPTGVPLPPLKTDQTAPATLAAYLLDNVNGHTWDGGTLRLHVHHPDAKPLLGMVAGWFDYGLGRAVVVPDIPAPQAPGGTTRYSGMVAAARFTIPTDGRPVVDFRLRADVPNDSYQITRWSDVPVATTWANVGTTTWAQYEPGTTAGGQGTLTIRWDDLPYSDAGNLVTNPSFETNTAGWSAGNATIARQTNIARVAVGLASLNVTPTVNGDVNVSGTTATIAAGTQVTMSLYLFGGGVVDFTIGGATVRKTVTFNGDFQRIEATMTTASAASACTFTVNSAAAGANFYIDGVSVVPGPSKPPTIPWTWDTYDPSLTWFDHRTIPKP